MQVKEIKLQDQSTQQIIDNEREKITIKFDEELEHLEKTHGDELKQL